MVIITPKPLGPLVFEFPDLLLVLDSLKQMDITSLWTLSPLLFSDIVLPNIFGHCTPWTILRTLSSPNKFRTLSSPKHFSDIVLPEKFSDIVLPENFLDIVLPEKISDIVLPEKNLDIVLPEFFFDIFLPEHFLDIFDPLIIFFENPIFVEVWRASHASNPTVLLIKNF